MAPYLSIRQVVDVEPASLANRCVKILLQHPKLGFSYTALRSKKHMHTFTGFYTAAKPQKGSSLKQASLLTFSTIKECSLCRAAAKSLCQSQIGPFTEAASEKAHDSTGRLFSLYKGFQNGGSNGQPSIRHFSAKTDDTSILESNVRSPFGGAMCLEHLELTGYHLRKCFRLASSVDAEEIVSLLRTLSFYGFQRSDVKAMFAQFPYIVQVPTPQVSQCLQYFSNLGFRKNVVISLLLKKPALISCNIKRAGEVIDYFLSIGVSKEDLISMLACRPHVIEHDVKEVEGIINTLLAANFDKSDINTLVKKAPTVFTLRMGNVKKSLDFWFDVVGLEAKDLFRAILRRPNLLSYNVQCMFHTHVYLQSWIEPADLRKSVCRFAELLSYDPQTKLKPLIDFFLGFGISERDVAKVIYRRPQIMSCNIDRLKQVTNFLRNHGLKDKAVGKVLIASPQVFTLNTEVKLKRGVEFFQSLGFDKERDMEIVFSRCAQIFCCSIEKNLLPTYEFLSNLGLGKESLLKMITGFPSMLGLNVKLSLAPKYEFLLSEMNRTDKELVKFPQYFGYSLEGRIKPRHKLLAQQGLRTSLASMLACTDSDFQKRYLEPYHSTFPKKAVSEKGTAVQQLLVSNKKSKKKHALNTSELAKSKLRQQELLGHNQKESLFVKTRHEDCLMHDVWGPFVVMPKLVEKQELLYPAYFTRLFKNPIPCGIWIHAYRFDM